MAKRSSTSRPVLPGSAFACLEVAAGVLTAGVSPDREARVPEGAAGRIMLDVESLP